MTAVCDIGSFLPIPVPYLSASAPGWPPRKARMFFFEKKNQKTSPNLASLYPDKPQPQ
jgi:hypothetical protein